MLYRGSFTYRVDADANRVFESTPFGGGRIVGTNDGASSEVHYFLTDHLGSTRVVAKVTPTGREDLDRKDYYPFGKAWEQPDMPTSDNRYTFSGKELQRAYTSSADFLDFGARFYDPVGAMFLQQDPMAEDYFDITQYGFCRNNPIRYVDPTGMSTQESDSTQITHIEPVEVVTYKNNPLSTMALLFIWSASGWGEMWNNAVGQTNSTFNENVLTGLNLWQSVAISWGLSKLFRNPRNSSLKSVKKQVYRNADDLINAAGKLKCLKSGVRQGHITGDIDEIFRVLSQGGQKIREGNYIQVYTKQRIITKRVVNTFTTRFVYLTEIIFSHKFRRCNTHNCIPVVSYESLTLMS